MKNTTVPLLAFLIVLALLQPLDTARAQGPNGKSFGFGLSLGEPTALTLRFWTSRQNSWDAAIGRSYLGNPHIHGSYLWHFNDAFNSRIVSLYAGVGGVIGFGHPHGHWLYGEKHEKWYWHDDDDLVLAAKGVFGLQVIPRNTPLDIFLEVDPILGLVPGFGFDFMPAVGIRFYP
jgi:hypothetical protein